MADPFADIPIKGESKDPFADIPVKPSFGEKAEGFVYGLATGIPGMLGDIETMLPGGSEVGVKGQGALKGKETVFPTTENIREGLTKMGLPPPPNPAVKGYITAGEVAPAVVAGGKGLYEAGKGLYGGAKMLGERLALGKTSKALAEDLRLASKKQAGQIAKTSGEEMTAAEQRAAIAGKAEEKAGRGGEIALKPLPGVTTEMEAGRFKPIAQTAQDIGTKIKDSANKVMDSLRLLVIPTLRSINKLHLVKRLKKKLLDNLLKTPRLITTLLKKLIP